MMARVVVAAAMIAVLATGQPTGNSNGAGQSSSPGNSNGAGQSSSPGNSNGAGQSSSPGNSNGAGQSSSPGNSNGAGCNGDSGWTLSNTSNAGNPGVFNCTNNSTGAIITITITAAPTISVATATAAPATAAQATSAPATSAPVTAAPATAAPVSAAQATSAPATSAPVTAAPATAAPVSAAQATSAPATSAPVTAAPVTAAPVSAAQATSAPATSAPVTATPTTTAPTVPDVILDTDSAESSSNEVVDGDNVSDSSGGDGGNAYLFAIPVILVVLLALIVSRQRRDRSVTQAESSHENEQFTTMPYAIPSDLGCSRANPMYLKPVPFGTSLNMDGNNAYNEFYNTAPSSPIYDMGSGPDNSAKNVWREEPRDTPALYDMAHSSGVEYDVATQYDVPSQHPVNNALYDVPSSAQDDGYLAVETLDTLDTSQNLNGIVPKEKRFTIEKPLRKAADRGGVLTNTNISISRVASFDPEYAALPDVFGSEESPYGYGGPQNK